MQKGELRAHAFNYVLPGCVTGILTGVCHGNLVAGRYVSGFCRVCEPTPHVTLLAWSQLST